MLYSVNLDDDLTAYLAVIPNELLSELFSEQLRELIKTRGHKKPTLMEDVLAMLKEALSAQPQVSTLPVKSEPVAIVPTTVRIAAEQDVETVYVEDSSEMDDIDEFLKDIMA